MKDIQALQVQSNLGMKVLALSIKGGSRRNVRSVSEGHWDPVNEKIFSLGCHNVQGCLISSNVRVAALILGMSEVG